VKSVAGGAGRGVTRDSIAKDRQKNIAPGAGKDGVLTKDCHPSAENTTGAGGDAAATRAPTKSQ